MPRGIFTQCFIVLGREPVDIDAVEKALADFPLLGKHAAMEHWAKGGPSVLMSFQTEANGLVMVDTVDQPWPDDMGDPQTEDAIFKAWTMGHFGPIAYPGSLQRAMQQSHAWKEGRTIPKDHRGFIRARISYVFGAAEDAPFMPESWDAVAELQYLTRIVAALLALPGALCYFNPNGEMLCDLATLRTQSEQARSEQMIPLDLWTNLRLYPYDTDWILMDTVGNGQLNKKHSGNAPGVIDDVEAVFRKQYDYSEVASFLRQLTLYLQESESEIKDGDTIDDGPGKIPWQATLLEKSVAMPLRRAIRVIPIDGMQPPAKPS